MNGVTGRMGLRQHLERSVLAIRDAGGVPAADGTRIVPEPILVGRNADKLRALAERFDVGRWTTDLSEALAEPDAEVYFDAQITQLRDKGVRAAVDAGKAIYCEKPTAESLDAALDLARLVQDARLPNGVVQDKLFLPGSAEAQAARRQRLLRPDPVDPRRVRLLGLRGRLAARPAAGLELQARGGRRHRRRHVLPLAVRAGRDLRPGPLGLLPGRDAPSGALRRRRPVRRDGRRRGVRDLRAGRRDRRAAELVLDHPGVPRRAGRVPRRRHRGQRGGRAAGLPRAAPVGDAEAGLEPGPAGDRTVPRPVAAGAGQRGLRQRLQGAVGAVPQAPGRRLGVPVGLHGRRPRGPAGRARPAVVASRAASWRCRSCDALESRSRPRTWCRIR